MQNTGEHVSDMFLNQLTPGVIYQHCLHLVSLLLLGSKLVCSRPKKQSFTGVLGKYQPFDFPGNHPQQGAVFVNCTQQSSNFSKILITAFPWNKFEGPHLHVTTEVILSSYYVLLNTYYLFKVINQ